MKREVLLYILGIILISTILHSCRKKELPILTTVDVTNIELRSATSGGNITDEGSDTIILRGVCWGRTEHPTIADQMTVDGHGLGGYTSDLEFLRTNTIYYVRAYAMNRFGTAYGNMLNFSTLSDIIFNPSLTYGNTSDIEGNVYKTIQIGSQIWMAENLRTIKYNDGTAIPLVEDDVQWQNLNTAAYCWWDDDESENAGTYGALYNWYAVNTGKLCPKGWHVATDDEWHQLVLFLDPGATLAQDESNSAGGKLKEVGTTHWLSPNLGATNSSGFTGLSMCKVSAFGYFWTSTAYNTERSWSRELDKGDSKIRRMNAPNTDAFSVRCIKD